MSRIKHSEQNRFVCSQIGERKGKSTPNAANSGSVEVDADLTGVKTEGLK